MTRVGARSALDDYCRSYADERGHRPSALQVYEAGYNPSAARGRHGHWFAFLDDMELLGEREREVVRRHAEVLDGIEKESITKSYKLVTLQALLQMNKLRSGADVAEIAWAAHRIVTGDPRLLADTRSADMPDPASVSAGALARILAELAAIRLGGQVARRFGRLVPHRRPPVRPGVSGRWRCGRNVRRHG